MFILSSPCHGSQWLRSVLCCSCAVLGNLDLLLFQRVFLLKGINSATNAKGIHSVPNVGCFNNIDALKWNFPTHQETTAKVSPQHVDSSCQIARNTSWEGVIGTHKTYHPNIKPQEIFGCLQGFFDSWYIIYLDIFRVHFLVDFSRIIFFDLSALFTAVSTWSRSNFEAMPCHAPHHHTSRQLSEWFMRSLRKKGMQRTQVDAPFSYIIYVCLLINKNIYMHIYICIYYIGQLAHLFNTIKFWSL